MLIELDLNMNDAQALLHHCSEHQPNSGDFRENTRLKEALEALAEALGEAMDSKNEGVESSEMIDPQLLDAAVKLFGDKASALSWLSRPLQALGNKNAMDVPTEEALALILRIEHGIAS
ncbi:putative toxin-antitoxin system antitoxin component [Pseudomonas sp. 24 E 13]|uniref:antitoxin Xre/MbcA/ParS toxin-binding domain-containing protein n=1 Tax=Pseudomonas sp. 24 E 13 TaxID=1844095 RepID=UPI0008121765|nr:antitoxin Xre/MbcA/ParS toxin-binding domain-containing protein [Pseudomonas sp. 24 E 13]CRM19923.1 putative toxin-antitoxin system antitoxin component [Pseudomonas sp. 24 E 13]